MKMKCPHCGVSGRADASLSGKKVKCPKCDRLFLVPIVDTMAEPLETEVEESLGAAISSDSAIEEEPAVEEWPDVVETVPSDDEDMREVSLDELEDAVEDIEQHLDDDVDDSDILEDIDNEYTPEDEEGSRA